MKASYWKRMKVLWKTAYRVKIQEPMHEHREETVEKFYNRIDSVDVRAFGVGVYENDERLIDLNEIMADEHERLKQQATPLGQI